MALVLPSPSVTAPTPEITQKVSKPQKFRVYQRDTNNFARVPLDITFTGGVSNMTAQVQVRSMKDDAVVVGWTNVYKAKGRIRDGVNVPAGGWYQVDVRWVKGSDVLKSITISYIGVGEVFIAAGQSNSCHPGEKKNRDRTGMVSTVRWKGQQYDASLASSWDGLKWRRATDPLSPASKPPTGGGGSPWIFLGEEIAEKYGVPVAIISVGWGGTSTYDWRSSNGGMNLHKRIQRAAKYVTRGGARAVLWHQGEDDTERLGKGKFDPGETYTNLQRLVHRVHTDSWPMPWIMARAAYNPEYNTNYYAFVIADQNRLIDEHPLIFPGPETDRYIGPEYRQLKKGNRPGVHFNNYALSCISTQWLEAIEQAFDWQ